MAMAVAELFALKEQLAKQSGKSRAKKQVADPAKRSLAHAVRALRGCMRDREGIPEPGQELSALLANAVTDSYVRTRAKAARYRPSKPDKKLTGAPKVRKMTAQEKRQAKHRSRNNCRLVNVAITLRGMNSNKHWTVTSRTMLRRSSGNWPRKILHGVALRGEQWCNFRRLCFGISLISAAWYASSSEVQRGRRASNRVKQIPFGGISGIGEPERQRAQDREVQFLANCDQNRCNNSPTAALICVDEHNCWPPS